MHVNHSCFAVTWWKFYSVAALSAKQLFFFSASEKIFFGLVKMIFGLTFFAPWNGKYIFRMKTTFISTSWTSWRKQSLTFYNLQHKNWKYKIQSYLSQRFDGKILSFKEYLGFACYHTTWQNIVLTINNWNAQAKGKFQAFRYLNKIHKNPVSALRLFKTYYN